MIKSINFNTFHDAFKNCGRGESFTYNGFKALYDYLTELENSCNTQIELDPIGFDCEYVEYDDFEELQLDYDVETIQELYNNTTVIEFNNGSLIIGAY